jgi:hypothetical protein
LVGLATSADELEGKLYLPDGAGGFTDFVEAGALERVRGRPMPTMLKNTERNRRSTCSAPAAAEGRVFDEGEVVIREAAEAIAANGAEDSLVGTGAVGNGDGDGKQIGRAAGSFADELCR